MNKPPTIKDQKVSLFRTPFFSINGNGHILGVPLLGQTKQGIFSADFEGKNNTLVELNDGDNISLDCKVFLKQEKTVSVVM